MVKCNYSNLISMLTVRKYFVLHIYTCTKIGPGMLSASLDHFSSPIICIIHFTEEKRDLLNLTHTVIQFICPDLSGCRRQGAKDLPQKYEEAEDG